MSAASAALDLGLSVVHLAVVLGNLLLWIPRQTRRLHLWLVMATIFSWLGLGVWYGNLGYCFLPDWHWQLKRSLGETELPGS